jgi:hypothetical protein
MTRLKRLFPCAIAMALSLSALTASAMELSLTIGQAGSSVYVGSCQPTTLHRTDTGQPMKLCLNDGGTTGVTQMYFIPDSSANPGSFEFTFRLEDIPLEEQRSAVPDADDFYISGPQVGSGHPTITDYSASAPGKATSSNSPSLSAPCL